MSLERCVSLRACQVGQSDTIDRQLAEVAGSGGLLDEFGAVVPHVADLISDHARHKVRFRLAGNIKMAAVMAIVGRFATITGMKKSPP